MPPSILVITNIPSHHQIPFGKAMYRLLGERFRLAFRLPMSEDRRNAGWHDTSRDLPFAIRAWESDAAQREMLDCIRDFDVVVKGDASTSLVRSRIMAGKLTFCATERIWKKGFWRVISPRSWACLRREYWSADRPNYHLLAAGAYCAWDFARIGAFRGRKWKWGYFTTVPPTPPQPKPGGIPRILWAGRMIDWKQVSHLVEAAAILKRRGLVFHLELIGDGAMRQAIEKLILQSNLGHAATVRSTMLPEQVRAEMRNAHIYVLPSNFQEGWGAVINEAMGEGCCVVSSNGPGAAPWLIRHGETGFLYPNANVDALADILEPLLRGPERCAWIGRQAWESVRADWSPEAAADRLLALCRGLLGTAEMPQMSEGPCSQAGIQRPSRRFPTKTKTIRRAA